MKKADFKDTPNKALHLTTYSLRSFLAPASGSRCAPAFGFTITFPLGVVRARLLYPLRSRPVFFRTGFSFYRHRTTLRRFKVHTVIIMTITFMLFLRQTNIGCELTMKEE